MTTDTTTSTATVTCGGCGKEMPPTGLPLNLSNGVLWVCRSCADNGVTPVTLGWMPAEQYDRVAYIDVRNPATDTALKPSSTDELDYTMDLLTVAASDVITAYSDCLTRGYLKDHPEAVFARLNALHEMIAIVWSRAETESVNGTWGEPADGGWGARDLAEDVSQYRNHTCNCDYCLHAGADY